jgi:transcription elongation factor Elf1
MEQEFICPLCGERTSLYLDFDDGEVQQVVMECILCGGRSSIQASFHYPSHSYDLELVSDVEE